jgi:putative transposase
MQITHKIEIKPTKDQETQLEKACGCARFAYNWGLNKWKQMYDDWKKNNTLQKPNANLIKKEFNSIKESQFPWIYDSPKDANQQPFANLDKAFKKFFKKEAKFPKFKKKKGKSSFYISNDKFKIKDKVITLPKIGEVKLTELLRFDGKIVSGTIKKHAHKWFVSITVETNVVKQKTILNSVIGIDLGLINFATLSNGEFYESPKPLKRSTKKLKTKQRQLSKKAIGSNNFKKKAMQLGRLHYKVNCQRSDFLHKLSTQTCRENQTICLENLQVKNMMKNHKLARSISDAGWSEFVRQIEYKSKIFGNEVIFADRFYPSSKTCSNCGSKKTTLSLKERDFNCEICNFSIDRDLNAAINISRLGYSRTHACGHWTSAVLDSSAVSLVDETRITQVYTS